MRIIQEQLQNIKNDLINKVSYKDIMDKYKISRATLYRYRTKLNEDTENESSDVPDDASTKSNELNNESKESIAVPDDVSQEQNESVNESNDESNDESQESNNSLKDMLHKKKEI